MIGEVWSAVEAKMKALAFILTAEDTETQAGRNYWINVPETNTDQSRKGGIGSGTIAANRKMTVTVYYRKNPTNSRQEKAILEDQEKIIKALHGALGVIWYESSRLVSRPDSRLSEITLNIRDYF